MLEVSDLNISFLEDDAWVQVTDSVSFSLSQAGTLGIVGESGCGKSITVQSLLGLLDKRFTRVSAKIMKFEGIDLPSLNESQWRKVRGRNIAMIFQNPMSSLNPLMKVGKQIRESLTLHRQIKARDARRKCVELLASTGIREPEKRYNHYPHEFSGGMRQRVMIAMALAANPRLLIADEPTTALDVTIQAQILELIRALQQEHGMGLILISHDLGIVRKMVEDIIVMYAGQIIEQGKTTAVLQKPSHPYTQGLIKSIPKIKGPRGRLESIEGTVPSPQEFGDGCRFYDRCPYKEAECRVLKYALNGDGNQKSSCRRRHLLQKC